MLRSREIDETHGIRRVIVHREIGRSRRETLILKGCTPGIDDTECKRTISLISVISL